MTDGKIGEKTLVEMDKETIATQYRNMGYWDGKSDREAGRFSTAKFEKQYVYRAPFGHWKNEYWDGYWAGYYNRTFNPLAEDAPTNSMGASSSTAGTGAIDTFDPLLNIKNKMKRKMTLLLGRKKPL